jgi:hypothetical protein
MLCWDWQEGIWILVSRPHLSQHLLMPAVEDEASESESDADESETPSLASEDDHSTAHYLTPRPDGYPSAAAVRKAKADARTADSSVDALRGINEPPASPGLPGSPRTTGPA